MKRIVLTLAALMLVASTALAYVQPSNLSLTQPQSTTPSVTPNTDDQTGSQPPEVSGSVAPGTDIYRRRPPVNPPGGGPTKPVPEPGTMMLASMGLLALGAAMRRRHH